MKPYYERELGSGELGLQLHQSLLQPRDLSLRARPGQATLRTSCRQNRAFFFLEFLDPGSGRNIPAKWHGAGAYPGIFIPET